MTERDYGFGDFNNINLGNVEREISEDADGLRVLQDAALKRFKTNSLEGKTEWIGEVLRSWTDTIPNSSGFWKNSPYVGKITKCKVNIPELDEAIGKEKPCPTTDPNKPGPHQDRINKFRTFESRDPSLPPPPVGTKVRVSFEDPKNPQTSPGIYLGPVGEGFAATGMVAGQKRFGPGSPQTAHQNEAGRKKTTPSTNGGVTGLGSFVDLSLGLGTPPPPRETPSGPIQDRGVLQGLYWDWPAGNRMHKTASGKKIGLQKGCEYWVQKAVDHGFNEVSLMAGTMGVSSSKKCFPKGVCEGPKAKAWWRRFPKESITPFAKECRKKNIRVSCTYWPIPNKKWIDGFLKSGVAELAVKAGLYAIEFDMEHNWASSQLKSNVPKKYQYKCMLEAEHILFEGLRKRLDAAGGTNIKINVTVHLGRLHKWSSCAGYKGGYYMLNVCDELYLQMYSTQRRVAFRNGQCERTYKVYKPGGKKARKGGKTALEQERNAQALRAKCREKYKFSGPSGPGNYQREELQKFFRKKTGANIKTIILANYGQSWNLGDEWTYGPGEAKAKRPLDRWSEDQKRGYSRAIEGLERAAQAANEYTQIKVVRYWSSKWVWRPDIALLSAQSWHKMYAKMLRGEDGAIG